MTTVRQIDSQGNISIVAKYSVSPKKAVICAYAESLGDHNTWHYFWDNYNKYEHLVKERKYGFICGNFWARKERVGT